MASMRDIKRRKESIQSTQQITKAMKLVATVKLQRAKTRAENAKPYFIKTQETIRSIMKRSGDLDHPYLKSNGCPKKAVIVITSNRGLAGGYNSNVVKQLADHGLLPENTVIYGIGRKGIDYLSRRGYQIVSDDSDMINEPLVSDAVEMTDKILEAYNKGEIGEIYLAYTFFKNTVAHIPMMTRLLPVDIQPEDTEAAGSQDEESGSEDKKSDRNTPMNYEPEAEEALGMLIPRYLGSVIYGAFIEAIASENGARMQAMDAATTNAEEMIAKLSLAYNRARQGAITQELTEIISGAEALN